jgi:hypothetical protein
MNHEFKVKIMKGRKRHLRKEKANIQRDLVRLMKEYENMNYWLSKQKKEHLVDMNKEDILKVKEFFNSLDVDMNGGISIEELKFPMFILSESLLLFTNDKIFAKIIEN